MKKNIFILYFIVLLASCQSNKEVTQVESQNNQIEKDIDKELADELNHVLNDWLAFYKLDILSFEETRVSPFDIDNLKSAATIYYKKYSKGDTLYLPKLRDYSPNGRFHLNVFESMNVHLKNKKWYFSGVNDAHKIFLFDRQDSTLVLVASRNKKYLSDGAFWVDDDTFILAGLDKRDSKQSKYEINIYDIDNKTISTYNKIDTTLSTSRRWYAIDNMKKRGVIIE